MTQMYSLKSLVDDLNAQPDLKIMYRLPSYHKSTQSPVSTSEANESELAVKERKLVEALEKFNLKLNSLVNGPSVSSKRKAGNEETTKNNKKAKVETNDEPTAEERGLIDRLVKLNKKLDSLIQRPSTPPIDFTCFC